MGNAPHLAGLDASSYVAQAALDWTLALGQAEPPIGVSEGAGGGGLDVSILHPPTCSHAAAPGPAPALGRLLERTALRDWRAVTVLFFITTVLETGSLGHLNAFTPLFLRDELGMAPDEIGPWTGLLSATTFALAFPLAPFWGSLAERYSRKLMIVRAQYLEAFCYVMSGLSGDLTWFFLARLLQGLAFGNIALVIATQSLLTPDKRVPQAISIVQSASPIALTLGPPLGALVLPLIGLRGLFILDGIACLFAALLVTFLMPEPPGRDTTTGVMVNVRSTMGIVRHRAPVRWNFIAWFLTYCASRVVDTYIPVRIAELVRPDPATAIGLVLGGFGALTALFTALAGRAVERLGAARLFWPAMLAATALTFGVTVAPNIWFLAAFAWVRAVPVALTAIVLYAHLSDVVRRDERALVYSLTPMPRNFASFIAPLVAAIVAAITTPLALGVAVLSYAGAVVAAWHMRKGPSTPPGP